VRARGGLGTHPGQRHVGHHLGVTLTRDERIHHPPRRLPITSDTTDSSSMPVVDGCHRIGAQ
jgi:hypothetical protein